MADNRTMAQMLQAPIEGYEDAIVVPPINANNFELKQPLINLVQSNKFTGRQDPHNHLRFFNKVTSTFRHPEVPNTSIKLLLFPFSLDGEARDWLDKEPPRSILTWDDLVSKFINQYFPPSKTTYYRNEIITFYQKPNEAFNEAWERFKGLLRQCPHHGFSELHQLDTFYNSLNSNDQDALDSAAGGNFLDKMPQEGLAIIESKSKVRYSRSRASDSRVSTDAPLSNSSSSNNSFDMQQIAASLEDKMTIKMNQMLNQMKALVVTTPAPVKAVEEVCVTCGSNHHFKREWRGRVDGDDNDIDGGGWLAEVAARRWGGGRLWLSEKGGLQQRVAASDREDQIYRAIRIIFGFGRKSPPKNVSGSGVVVAGIRRRLPEMRERDMRVCVIKE
ncbi:reverse transcriptase domain-containing protein [Tanacetum coccineum]